MENAGYSLFPAVQRQKKKRMTAAINLKNALVTSSNEKQSSFGRNRSSNQSQVQEQSFQMQPILQSLQSRDTRLWEQQNAPQRSPDRFSPQSISFSQQFLLPKQIPSQSFSSAGYNDEKKKKRRSERRRLFLPLRKTKSGPNHQTLKFEATGPRSIEKFLKILNIDQTIEKSRFRILRHRPTPEHQANLMTQTF